MKIGQQKDKLWNFKPFLLLLHEAGLIAYGGPNFLERFDGNSPIYGIFISKIFLAFDAHHGGVSCDSILRTSVGYTLLSHPWKTLSPPEFVWTHFVW